MRRLPPDVNRYGTDVNIYDACIFSANYHLHFGTIPHVAGYLVRLRYRAFLSPLKGGLRSH